MDKRPPRPMTPFDELVSSPQLQTIKLLLPYAPAPGQRLLAAFIKFFELRRAILLFSRPSSYNSSKFFSESSSGSGEFLDSLKPYLDPRESEMLDMVLNMKDIMEMAQMMQDSSGGSPAFDPMDLMAGMLSPEQQEMFSTYSDMFSQALDKDRKGDDDSGRMDERSRTEGDRSGEAGTDPHGSGTDEREDRT